MRRAGLDDVPTIIIVIVLLAALWSIAFSVDPIVFIKYIGGPGLTLAVIVMGVCIFKEKP